MRPSIKFCGLCRVEDARLAAELGAAYVGAILAPSPRRVSPAEARATLGAARGAKKVGVFGDAPIEEIAEAASVAEVDVIQLHSGQSAGALEKLRDVFGGEIWVTVRVGTAGIHEADSASLPADAILVDSYSSSRLGGTGASFDWDRHGEAVRRVAAGKPLVLAGGLRSENVAHAIGALDPDVVDVSSGVESAPGVKDHALMRAFRDAVAATNGG